MWELGEEAYLIVGTTGMQWVKCCQGCLYFMVLHLGGQGEVTSQVLDEQRASQNRE